MKQQQGDIGDGFLTEGGWDPFGEGPRGGGHEKPGDDFRDLDAGSGKPEGSTARGAESQAAAALEELFQRGDYRKALSEATALRSKSATDSVDRDVAEFICGASNYFLGQFQEAQSLLDSHVNDFKASRHRESALFYQASNRVRLRQWPVGAALLDRYIQAYPESLLQEFALFDRATCHFALGEYEACLKVVNQLGEQFLYSKIRDRGLVLKGDVLQELGEFAAAQTTYQAAMEAAVELKHRDLEARCLANLTAVAAARGQNAAAVKYYKAFFKDHAGSGYASMAALGGLPALKATGDLDSGLNNLERLLQELPQSASASVLNDGLVEYAKFYGEKFGPEKLLRQLGDLSSSPQGSERLKEQLVIARLEALETYFPERLAEIRVFYKEMRSRFKPSDLSSANVLKLADYIAEQNPDEAVKWYDNALARSGTLHKDRATLGLANSWAKLGLDREAEAGFRKVLETFGSPELAEDATLGVARIVRKKKDWNAAAYYWTSYLEQKDWNRAREEARNGLDESKLNGGTAKAPPRQSPPPLQALPNDPVAAELAQAERMAAAGDKAAAYDVLDRMLKRLKSADKLPESSVMPFRKAQMLREDLAVELGR